MIAQLLLALICMRARSRIVQIAAILAITITNLW
jgi:hypothetical protein